MTDQPRRARPIPRDALPSRQEREQARQQGQEYRAYAEAWYRALRTWQVDLPRVPTPALSYGFARGFEPLTLGELAPDLPSALVTPVGQLREVEVGRAISQMAASSVPDQRAAGQLLERVRGSFTAPASLLREGGGWASPAPRMAGYAVAVLTLAVAMGDQTAEEPLRYAGAVMRRVSPSE